jgi:hypothetical protein
MHRKVVYLKLSCFVLYLMMTDVSADLTSDFQQARDLVNNSVDLDPGNKANFIEMINFAEQHSSNGVTGFSAAEELMDAILVQLVTLMFAEEPQSSVAPLQGDDGEEFIGQFVQVADSIRAALFFGAPELQVFPTTVVEPLAGDCTAIIFVRVLGPMLYETGGTLLVVLGFGVDLEVQAELEGGVFTWSLEPSENTLSFSQGKRFSFRATDTTTYRITVTYSGPASEQCSNSILVKVQGDLPEEE